ncbi:hypothetical protein CLH62_12580 [Marinobacter guineae]|uniref:OmpA-like domain-containing protein n=1 Tax=Marinobacter guineae TaxID=432303 RepID=A0A2G1VEH4_9GAMM|nr:OmpA family protein [Marinobacter guineae]PHQ25177.1 hypothetical protein CLH62_12580 [Marinobacter guineae]
MKWINSFRLFFAMVCVLGAANSMAEPISSQFLDALDGLQEYSSQHTDFSQYELILGKMRYQYPRSPDETEGFKAEASRIFEGRIDRKVFDFNPDVGSLKAFSTLKDFLDGEGFNIAFTCEGSSCGSVKGWGTFFPDQADGSSSDQFYLSAIYPENGPPERVFSSHISMIGNRVRVTIDEVVLLVDMERSIENYANAVLGYWSEYGFDQGLPVTGYGLGSYELTTTMKLKYRAIAKIMENNPDFPIKLSGYTDLVGEESVNRELSLVRAKSVADFLVTMGVPEDSLSFEGRGVFNYMEEEVFDNVAPQHRKVIVVAFPAKEISSLN